VAGRTRLLQVVQDKGPSAVADEMIPKLLGETTRSMRPAVVELVRSLAIANSSDAIAGAIRALMTRPDSTPLLSSIHVPTLVLVGDEDAVTPPPASEEMHHAIAGSELVRIPQAGHLSNLEQPELFNAALAAFLTHRV
jgi:pimeloyl-ACP methyl ester carboxylesterase